VPYTKQEIDLIKKRKWQEEIIRDMAEAMLSYGWIFPEHIRLKVCNNIMKKQLKDEWLT